MIRKPIEFKFMSSKFVLPRPLTPVQVFTQEGVYLSSYDDDTKYWSHGPYRDDEVFWDALQCLPEFEELPF